MSSGPSLTKCISPLKRGIPGTLTLQWHWISMSLRNWSEDFSWTDGSDSSTASTAGAARREDLDDIRGLLTEYEADSERLFSDVVIYAGLADFGLAPAFLLGVDLRALCTPEELAIVNAFLAAMNENHPAWMSFVRARGVGDDVEEDARAQLDALRRGFEQIPR